MHRFMTAMSKVLCMGICLFMVATSALAADYKKEYNLSVVPGPTSGWGVSAQYFADAVHERTQGRVNIKVYCAGQLFSGKQTNEFLLLRKGTINFAFGSTINWSPQVKELNLTSMPFFLGAEPDPYKAIDAVLAGKAGKMLIEAVEKKGVHVIGWAENGYRQLTTSKGPITSPADLKGLKIRVVGSPIFVDIFRALGANPVSMNWSEAITGFQQGVVDGQENPTNSVNLSLKIWEYHQYNCEWNYMIDPLLISVNPDDWAVFTPEDQKIIIECAKLAERFSKAMSRIGIDDGRALAYLQSIGKVPAVTDPLGLLAEKGMTVTKLTPEQVKAFADATKGVRETWTRKVGPELVKAAEADMASVR